MFSTSEIVANCTAKSFERGRNIASREDGITHRRFSEGRLSCEISGDVRSQSGVADSFHAYIATDPAVQVIIDYGCTCPAARKHDSMCKHCVALALSFKSDPSTFAGFGARFEVSTSRSIKRFLDLSPAYSDMRLPSGSAHLDLEIVYGFGEWKARFRISAGGPSYVVSDIGALAKALATRSTFEYGRKLSFVHTIEAFDEHSRGMAAFLASREEEFASARRELSLGPGEVVQLLDAIDGGAFSLANVENGNTAESVKAVRENPDIALRIVHGDEPGSYEIMRDEQLFAASGAEGAYVFADGMAYRCSEDFAFAAAFLENVYLSADEELVIAPEDVASFCANMLPGLEGCMRISYPEELEQFKPKEARFSFYLDKVGSGSSEAIELTVKVSYGNGETTLLAPSTSPVEGEPSDAYHDEEAESRIVKLALEFMDMTMRIPLDEEEAAGMLLYEGIPMFQAAGDVFTTPEFDTLISDKKVRLQIGLSLAGNLINMDIQSSDVENDELAAILSAYQRKRRFHRLKDGTLASLADMEAAHLDRLAQDLGLSARDLKSGKIELPTYAAFFLDREYAEAVRDVAFEEYVDAFENRSLDDCDPPQSLEGVLRPYQLDGYRWLRKLASIGFGGILADEMGLGKSLQLIAFLLSLKESGELAPSEKMSSCQKSAAAESLEHGPALIVCPASLVYNWAEEISKFAPSLSAEPIDGDKAERRRKRRTEGVDVFIASYDAVRMDSEAFEQERYSVVALDEAQFIKNHATKTARAVKRLHAAHRFALTGTPIENRLSEIWSLFDFLMPGFLGTYAQFRRRFEADIIGGDEDVARRLQSLIAPFVLRRLKKEVLLELPDKQESVVAVALEGEQKRLYDAHEQKLRNDLLAQRNEHKKTRWTSNGTLARDGVKVDVLAELMRLRQVAIDPSLAYDGFKQDSAKTEAIMELVAEAMESGKKALVFSQFTSYLDVLKNRLDAQGVAYYEITGSTPKKERVRLVGDFNEDDVPVFLVSLKAGGTGLNLIGASVVIHADPWWNAAAINQATDRAHRIGQSEMVSVYKVIAKGTIEERILRLQQSKEELADSVVGETSLANLSSLTREELESLLLD